MEVSLVSRKASRMLSIEASTILLQMPDEVVRLVHRAATGTIFAALT